MASRPRLGPKQLRLTAAAERDLDEIARHLEQQAGTAVALRFATRLDATLVRLAALGHSGVARDWVAPGLRLHVVGRWCVYFRVTTTETLVLRILHGHRDVGAIRFDPGG
jgi:toxin ParE1/3/4